MITLVLIFVWLYSHAQPIDDIKNQLKTFQGRIELYKKCIQGKCPPEKRPDIAKAALKDGAIVFGTMAIIIAGITANTMALHHKLKTLAIKEDENEKKFKELFFSKPTINLLDILNYLGIKDILEKPPYTIFFSNFPLETDSGIITIKIDVPLEKDLIRPRVQKEKHITTLGEWEALKDQIIERLKADPFLQQFVTNNRIQVTMNQIIRTQPSPELIIRFIITIHAK